MKRRALPVHVLAKLTGAPTPAAAQEHYYERAQDLPPRKRAGFLLRAVCDLWEQQGADRARLLKWKPGAKVKASEL